MSDESTYDPFRSPAAMFGASGTPSSDEIRHAVAADAGMRRERVASGAAGVRVTGPTINELDSAVERCLAELLDVQRQLGPIRPVPAVGPIYGSRRISPLTPRSAVDVVELEEPDELEPDDPVAFPELAVIPATDRCVGTLRMMRDFLERLEPSPDGIDIAFAKPPNTDLERLHASPIFPDSRPDPVPNANAGPGPYPVFGFEYRSLATAAADTSLAREAAYRVDCFRQEIEWRRQLSDLNDIRPVLDLHAEANTNDYLRLCDRFMCAFHWMAGNRSAGIVAWCATCVRWAAIYAEDVAEWILRRADGTDRADGHDFPFADVLNKMPDFFDLPAPAASRRDPAN